LEFLWEVFQLQFILKTWKHDNIVA
jgi:hypothetical protein